MRSAVAQPVSERYGFREYEYSLRKLRKCLDLYVSRAGPLGFGVFAAKPFAKGDAVMVDLDGDYYDRVVSYRELQEHGFDIANTIQVGRDAFKLPSGCIDDLTNHSCDPNTGIRLMPKGVVVVALRDIAAHEELTYDYSTYLNNPYESMTCLCSAANCRGVIGSFGALPEDVKRRYLALGIVGDFCRE
jgi:SET domain-containing protein